MRKIQESTPCWVRTVNLQKKKTNKNIFYWVRPVNLYFLDIHLTVCAICTTIPKPRISFDFILKWPNCHIDRLCFLRRIVSRILISRYIVAALIYVIIPGNNIIILLSLGLVSGCVLQMTETLLP